MASAAPSGRASQLRAAFVLFHALSMVVLSLPAGLTSETRWNAKTTQRDLADWAARLRQIGVQTDKASLERRLKGLAEDYIHARSFIAMPFALYARVTLSHQGWAMFASPVRRPYELHVDGLVAGSWVPLSRPQNPSADLFEDYLSNDRVRKFTGRFPKSFNEHNYTGFARHLARVAFAARPDVERIRVALYGYETLPPERAAKGEKPKGEYEHALEITRQDVL
jgi:hypothetical protein